MVDTVHWDERDRQYLHEKVLLGGILKRFDDDQEQRSREKTSSEQQLSFDGPSSPQASAQNHASLASQFLNLNMK